MTIEQSPPQGNTDNDKAAKARDESQLDNNRKMPAIEEEKDTEEWKGVGDFFKRVKILKRDTLKKSAEGWKKQTANLSTK